MLKTKSVQLVREPSDGIRICVMRRIKPEFDFDMWILPLSPSTELLKQYHEKSITWDEYEKLFTIEVLRTTEEYLKVIAQMAEEHTVTLLCWEENPLNCHRRLIAEKIQADNPKLTVNIA